jgi:hypothetical protein
VVLMLLLETEKALLRRLPRFKHLTP